MKREPYPLQWPEGWKRTSYGLRQRSKFEPHFTEDRDAVLRWLDRRGSRVVMTSNLPTRQDGLPYYASTSDPGIAVWWVEKGAERVIACDAWNRADENMRAIVKTLDAMRGLDRWGATEMAERAFAGFAALPPGPTGTIPPASKKRPWREVLGGMPGGLEASDELVLAKARHRKLIAAAHPDAGGSHDAAAALNAAIAEAEAELRA